MLSGLAGFLTRHRRSILLVTVGLAVTVAAGGAWLVHRAQQARVVVAGMQADGHRLEQQLRTYDLIAAGRTMARLRVEADQARSFTGDPIWRLGGFVPIAGGNLQAAQDVSATVAGIADAAQPLEEALPRLDPRAMKSRNGQIDVQALQTVANTLPAISDAVTRGDATVQTLDAAQLIPQIGGGVGTLQRYLAAVRAPLANAGPAVSLVPRMLGADGPRTWLVLLQQGAEARGTGGIVGAYAVVRTDRGHFSLVTAAQRATLQARSSIPVNAVPQELQDLWQTDLTEWAGLNLSPHFPWTGQMVAAGWKAGRDGPPLDYVVGVDQGSVAALLAGTGPVVVRGITVSQNNAVRFLTCDVYQRFPDYHDVDAVTAELVRQVFQRVAGGHVNLGALIKAMAAPVRERRLLMWSSHPDEEKQLADLTIGGALPDGPGPFAMAVVNNGGGNKLDAFLKVHTAYDPGPCTQDVRIGHISVTLDNTAPHSGLPDYVSVRTDLKEQGIRNRVVGSNRLVVDVYGPVDAQSPLATVDGEPVPVTAGVDRGHAVWRIVVTINPGQRRTVDVVVVQPEGLGTPDGSATVLTQPMAIPATAQAADVPSCRL